MSVLSFYTSGMPRAKRSNESYKVDDVQGLQNQRAIQRKQYSAKGGWPLIGRGTFDRMGPSVTCSSIQMLLDRKYKAASRAGQ
jgi:hypothetical protein